MTYHAADHGQPDAAYEVYCDYADDLGEAALSFDDWRAANARRRERQQAVARTRFSQDEIWHAARYWGCSDDEAVNILDAEERRFAEDD